MRRSFRASRRRAPRRTRSVAIAVVLVLLVAVVADLAYVGIGLNRQLRNVAANLDSVRADLQSGRLVAARSALRTAADGAREAEKLLRQPAWRVISIVPGINRETDSLEALVTSAGLLTNAGEPGLKAAAILDYREGAVGSSVYEDGRINLDTLREAEPLVLQVQESLTDAAKVLASTDDALLRPVQSAVERARARVRDAAGTASNAVSLMRLLPRLTGGDGTRRYLLAFQALGEARATGGVAGLFGVLTATDGRVKLGRIAPHTDLVFSKVKGAFVPSWYEESYGIQGSLKDWRQANLSPNFPVVARVMLDMYEQSFDQKLDGVLAVDAIALSKLTQGTGSFEVPGYDKTITPDNAADVLSRDAYVDFPNRNAQNAFLAELVRTFWSKIEEGDVDAQALATGLGEAVDSRHLMLFATDRGDQGDLEELGIDGSLDSFGPNLQMIFHNNYAINKVDYFMHRSIDTDIEIGAGGDLRVTNRVTLRNDSPAAPKSDLLGGMFTKLAPGTNRLTLNFLMPERARPGRIKVDGKAEVSIDYREDGHPLQWEVVTVPPGEESVVTLTYVVPNGASLDSEGGELSFSFVPQPLLNLDDFALTVSAPGYVLRGGGRSSRDQWVLEQELSSPTTVTLDLERP